MAEAEAAGHATKGIGSTLGKKVGPLPLGVWLAIGGGVWWWTQRQNAKAAGSAAQSGGTQNPGYGTDPAGNFGLIDPNTGYVAGSSSDLAAQRQNAGDSPAAIASGAGGGGGGGDTSGTGGTSTGTTTPPATGTTGTTGGTSAGWRYPAPGGLAANSISDSGFRLAWQPVTGPGGQHPSSYTVVVWQGNNRVSQHVVNTTNSIEYGTGGKGLKPGATYLAQVWANGGPLAPPGSKIPVTTLRA